MKKLFFFATLIAATAFGLTSCSDSNGGDSPSGTDGEGVTAYLRVNLNRVGSAAGVASSKPFLRDATHENPGTGTYQDGTPDEGAIQNVRFYFFKSDGSAYTLTGKGGENNADISNFLDISSWTVNTTDDDLTTVERRTNGVLVINGTSEAMPDRMLALVNLDDDAKATFGNTALSESDVIAKAKTIQKYTTQHANDDGSSNTYFVMSSTGYINDGVVHSSSISASNYAATADAAKNVSPVQVYVERLAARVDVNKGTNAGWGTVSADQASDDAAAGTDMFTLTTGKTLSYIDNSGTTNQDATPKDQIYVVIKGWGLADENNNAPISKSLDPQYGVDGDLASNATGVTNTLTAQPLSVSDYHRSFWETAEGYKPIRYTFSQYAGFNATNAAESENYATNNDAYHKSLGKTAYTFPNTPTAVGSASSYNGWANGTSKSFTWNETNRRAQASATAQAPTKVVVAAKLMYADENGKLQPATICTYGADNYLGEASLKKAIAADLYNSTNNKLCKRTAVTGDGDETTYTYSAIDTTDIEFVVSGDPGTNKSYKVTPKIKTEGGAIPAGKEYYTYNTTTKEYEQVTDIADINGVDNDESKPGKLKSVAGSDITIYRGGNTYYYTTLQHLWFPDNFDLTAQNVATTLPTNAGAWGVVRNHLYNVTLTDIQGWGTPVYDPTEIIIPVTPSNHESYLGAQINVLMWRVVDQTVSLDGTAQ